MFNSNIVFVVGAGASKEFNLPIGDELTRIIAELVDIRHERFDGRISGDHLIAAAIDAYTRNRGGTEEYNNFLHSCWHIRDAMPLALSIDSFVESHSNDARIPFASKLAIARAILSAEQNSTLMEQDVHNRPGVYTPEVNLEQNSATWLAKFMKLLTTGCTAENLEDQLSRITFISFNYDRCIEQYLSAALARYYKLSQAALAEAQRHLRVFHPYGMVGLLPWMTAQNAVPFGAKAGGDKLIRIAEQIRTYSESVESETIQNVHATLNEADIIVFLGFAFHPQNMRLLNTGESLFARHVFATALDASASDCEAITTQIYGLLGVNIDSRNVQVRNDKTCSKMFDEYWRSFSQF